MEINNHFNKKFRFQLPTDTQTRVSQYVMSKTKSSGSIQSKNGNENESFDTNEYEFNISASLMSKILEDSIQDSVTKHCDTCTCAKAQNKPFAYDETHYSTSTQTFLTGEIIDSPCTNCKLEVKSAQSNVNTINFSPNALKEISGIDLNSSISSTQLVTQNQIERRMFEQDNFLNNNFHLDITPGKNNVACSSNIKTETKHSEDSDKIDIAFKHLPKNINMEPGVHHKLCEKTRNSMSSNKGSNHSVIQDDPLIKDNISHKEPKHIVTEEISIRKNSHGSMGAISRTSSMAKSTTSTHKSNTQVGPGPRFCSLRMQAGSKNILLDNAQPDVPPVLYKRQMKGMENSVLKDMNDVIDNFLDMDKTNMIDIDTKKDSTVIESTLIDVQVDNNNKDNILSKNNSINPILMNVSSCPLEPLKTHSFSNGSENNHSVKNNGSQKNVSQIDNLLNTLNLNEQNNVNKSFNVTPLGDNIGCENNDIQMFNFDRYEQNKMTKHYAIRKIDMSNLHTIENTKISKDHSPQGELPKANKKVQKPSLPPIVNVYPNLTQTHLKVNENKKVLTNEHSTSSLSSDDSAALLQKQQLLRVAEWVEQNLEQQNNLNDPLEDDITFSKSSRRDSKLRLADTLELALKMPHPVSKYSKAFTRDEASTWSADNANLQLKSNKSNTPSVSKTVTVKSIVKETVFPAENVEPSITAESKVDSGVNVDNNFNDFRQNKDKNITPEELARMEYNVKQFLMSGPYWENTEPAGRNRRTSSKTETDV